MNNVHQTEFCDHRKGNVLLRQFWNNVLNEAKRIPKESRISYNGSSWIYSSCVPCIFTESARKQDHLVCS